MEIKVKGKISKVTFIRYFSETTTQNVSSVIALKPTTSQRHEILRHLQKRLFIEENEELNLTIEYTSLSGSCSWYKDDILIPFNVGTKKKKKH